jgi:hypothetical protein
MRIFVIGSISSDSELKDEFISFCQAMGTAFANKSVEVILCSPYELSADLQVIKGIAKGRVQKVSLEIHYPNTSQNEKMWDNALSRLKRNVKVVKFRHEAPDLMEDSIKYSWLFCQIQAVSKCDFAIVLGGKSFGSSNLLSRIAEAENKTIIPLPKFGGVGSAYFEKKRYHLDDVWGNTNVKVFRECDNAKEIVRIINNGAMNAKPTIRIGQNDPLIFFISYPRERPAEADFIEMILRRRNYEVLRDENDFKASEDIPSAIKERIHKSDVFIALWSKEYACSPWCFDELSLALSSHRKQGKFLWIFRVDNTRMVHPQARNILWYDTVCRTDIEAKILHLLGELS